MNIYLLSRYIEEPKYIYVYISPGADSTLKLPVMRLHRSMENSRDNVQSRWNVMAHGDAREGKWRGNWLMEWVASPPTLPRNMVYPALLPLMRTPRLPVVDWTDAPRRFKWARPFRRETKSGFCSRAVTFQTQSTIVCFRMKVVHLNTIQCISRICYRALLNLSTNDWI
jgi:hypothetical protein